MIAWFQANADRAVTLDELTAHFNEYHRGSVSSAVGILTRKLPDNLVKVAQGVWRYDSKSHPILTVQTKTELLLTEVKRKDDGTLLMMDSDTNLLYVVREFDF